jgi:hypothetical protein
MATNGVLTLLFIYSAWVALSPWVFAHGEEKW